MTILALLIVDSQRKSTKFASIQKTRFIYRHQKKELIYLKKFH